MRTSRSLLLAGWVAALVCGALPGPAHSQSQAAGGLVEGVVTDESGAVVRRVSVEARNVATGFARSATTNAEGRYGIPLLPVGTYVVRAALPGFATMEVRDVTVTVGAARVVDITMKLSSLEQEVTVTAVAEAIETTQSNLKASLDERAVHELPTLARNFQTFAFLTPGVVLSRSPVSESPISIGGQKGIHTQVTVDGAAYNSHFFGSQTGGSRPPFTVSLEAIKEFVVLTNGFSAEFGRSGGGLLNAVTKSGTNRFEGSAWWYLQDRRFVGDDALGNPPKGRRQQFGASLGGPLRRDKLFFLANVDFQRRSEPTNLAFNGQPILQAAASGSDPNRAAAARALLDQQSQILVGDDVNSVLLKLDWTINASHALSTRLSAARNLQPNGTFGLLRQRAAAPTNFGFEKDLIYTSNTQLTSVLGANKVNELRFNYTFEDRPRVENEIPGTSDVNGVKNGAEVLIAPIGIMGAPFFLPIGSVENRFQVSDNFSLSLGRHDLKVGTDLHLITFQNLFRGFARGRYTFATFDDFVARRPSQYIQFFGSGQRDTRYGQIAVFAQDSFKPRPGLTLNYGLRWEAQLNPEGDIPNPDFLEGTKEFPDDTGMWSPRLGIAWDPGNDRRNVVRLFTGYLHANTPTLLSASVFRANGDVRNGTTFFTPNPSSVPGLQFNFPYEGPYLTAFPSFPGQATLTQGTVPGSTVHTFDPNFRNPRIFRANAGYERALGADLTASVTADYSRTTHNQRFRDVNLFPPSPDPVTGRMVYDRSRRPVPVASFVIQRESTALARYYAVTAAVQKRYSHRFQLQAFYTWSRNYTDDDNEREANLRVSTDDFDHRQDWGPASHDIRHNFVLNGVWTLPLDFQLSGILAWQSGYPFDALTGNDSPALAAATAITPAALENFRRLLGDPNATVYVGGNGDGNIQDRPMVNGRVLQRNFFRQPSFFNVDLRLAKAVPIGGRARLQVLMDLFNVFDNANRTTTNTVMTSPAFGSLNNVGPPRAFQVGARLSY